MKAIKFLTTLLLATLIGWIYITYQQQRITFYYDAPHPPFPTICQGENLTYTFSGYSSGKPNVTFVGQSIYEYQSTKLIKTFNPYYLYSAGNVSGSAFEVPIIVETDTLEIGKYEYHRIAYQEHNPSDLAAFVLPFTITGCP